MVRGFAGEQAVALAVHRFPANKEQMSDEMLEKAAKQRRQDFLHGVRGQKGSNAKQ